MRRQTIDPLFFGAKKKYILDCVSIYILISKKYERDISILFQSQKYKLYIVRARTQDDGCPEILFCVVWQIYFYMFLIHLVAAAFLSET